MMEITALFCSIAVAVYSFITAVVEYPESSMFSTN